MLNPYTTEDAFTIGVQYNPAITKDGFDPRIIPSITRTPLTEIIENLQREGVAVVKEKSRISVSREIHDATRHFSINTPLQSDDHIDTYLLKGKGFRIRIEDYAENAGCKDIEVGVAVRVKIADPESFEYNIFEAVRNAIGATFAKREDITYQLHDTQIKLPKVHNYSNKPT